MALLEIEKVLQDASIGFWNIKMYCLFCLACILSANAPMFYPIAFAEMDFMCFNSSLGINQCFNRNGSNTTVACSRFEYFSNVFDSTVRKDFNLICGEEMYADFDLSIMLIAQCFSVTLGSFLMDAFGRKPVFNFAACVTAMCSIGYLFVPKIGLLLLLRFFDCFALNSLVSAGFLLMIEDLSLKYSVFATNSSSHMIGLGFSFCTLISYLFRNWKLYVFISMTIPAVVTAVSSLIMLDESPRWLLQKRNFKEFEIVINRIFNQNNKEVPKFLAEAIEKMKAEKVPKNDSLSVLALLNDKMSNVKFWKLCGTIKTTMWMSALALSWIATVVVYIGMQFGKELFGGIQIHVYFFINGIAEIPGAFLHLYMAKYWGRKPANIVSYCLCTLSLTICPFIPRDGYWIILIYVEAVITRIFITSAFTNIYMWSGEIMPTNFRGVGMGLGSLCGRIVGIFLPYVKSLSKMWSPLPALIFAWIAFSAGMSSFVLPETRNQISPDDIEEYQSFGTDHYRKLKQKRINVLKTSQFIQNETSA